MPKRLVLVKRPDPRRVPKRLRALGVLLLVAGVLGAGATYWINTHRTEPTIEELLPGTARANRRQVGMMYGHGVQSMWDIYEDWKLPEGQALTVFAISGLAAAGCFRAAWLREHGE